MSKRYSISQIRVSCEYSEQDVITAIHRSSAIPKKFILNPQVRRRSIDARRGISYVLTVDFDIPQSYTGLLRNVRECTASEPLSIPRIHSSWPRPLIVGAGPAGLAAAYILSRSGLRPRILERGSEVKQRVQDVKNFWDTGVLKKDSNMLCGEGGAGLFSDGKLTARNKNKGAVQTFMNMLVEAGASESIRIDAHPHIGSDRLIPLVSNLRKTIEDAGGEFFFNTSLRDIVTQNGRVVEAITDNGSFEAEKILLCTGHSARDVYEMLHGRFVALQPKGFAMGVRAELHQQRVNTAMYGMKNPPVGAAEFRLSRSVGNDSLRVYSFCMCPGGRVVSCASSPGMLTTNGMSYSKRDLSRANAAFLVPVSPQDFSGEGGDTSPLAGIEYQKIWEKKAFEAGGQRYSLPASTLADFLSGSPPRSLPNDTSAFACTPADITPLLPAYIVRALKEALPPLMRRLGENDFSQVVIYGVETRSSSPVQIVRGKDRQSISHKNLYPVGEGAGYAGGIVSSGVDGIKTALEIVREYE
ncbi:MAG: NAD(P)/FAD-dependent oxidoreductase [Fibrobacterota bacterium]